ncbi:MAG: hypothetical protein V2A73_07540 [Pseudomonadota bacterium]
MGRRDKSRTARRQDVIAEIEAVLARPAPPAIAVILDLIRRVNPTGHDLPAAETDRRYKLKARLQSLLVRCFGEQLGIESDEAEAQAGVVLLRHLYSGIDACHAVLDELDEDARAAIQLRLDVDRSPAMVAAEPPMLGFVDSRQDDHLRSPNETAHLLAQGRDALVVFDYELAEERFREALGASRNVGDTTTAALALLELFVDQLGMDSTALDLESILPPAVLADERIALFLALASARLGNRSKARSWLSSVTGGRRLAVMLALARQALESGDFLEAEGTLADIRDGGVVESEIGILATEIEEAKNRARAPLEAELVALCSAGNHGVAEEKAHELLRQFSDSPVARRALRTIEGARQAGKAAQALQAAEKALAVDRNLTEARRRLHEAAALGAATGGLAAQLEKAEEEAHQQRVERRASEIARKLESDDRTEGLEEFLGLDCACRTAVRHLVCWPALDWLEQLDAAKTRASARALIAAIGAFEQATAALEKDGADAALAILAPYERELAVLPAAAGLLRDARQRKLELRRQQAEQTLAKLLATDLASADYPQTMAALQAIDASLLSNDSRAARRSLEDRLQRCAEVEKLSQRLQRLESAGLLFQARDDAAALALLDASGRSRWSTKIAALGSRIDSELRLAAHALDPPDTLDSLPNAAHVWKCTASTPAPWLSPDGNELVIAWTAGNWVFVQIVDVASGEVRRIVRLRTPEPLGYLVSVHVTSKTLWIVGGVYALELALPDYGIRAFRSMQPFLAAGTTVCGALCSPEGDYLWIKTSSGVDSAMVIAVQRWLVCREVDRCFRMQPLIAADGSALVAAVHASGDCRLYSVRGTPVSRPWSIGVQAVASHWQDANFLVLGNDSSLIDDASDPLHGADRGTDRATTGDGGDTDGIGSSCKSRSDAGGDRGDRGGGTLVDSWVRSVTLDGTASSPPRVVSSRVRSPCFLATALASHCSFVLNGEDENPELFALGIGHPGRAPEVLWRAAVPRSTLLVQDPRHRHIVAVMECHDGVHPIRLASIPPPLAGSRWQNQEQRAVPASIGMAVLCFGFLRDRHRAWEKLLHCKELAATERASWLESCRRELADSPADLALLCRHLTGTESDSLLSFAREHHPDNSILAIVLAERLAAANRWEQARETILATAVDQLDDHGRQHADHILGLALLWLGDDDGARTAWQQGLAIDADCCPLRECLELLLPLPDPLQDSDWGPDRPLLRQVRGAIRAVDACLAQGDLDGAKRILERPHLRRADEPQLQVRLAWSYLESEPSCAAQMFRKEATLAFLCDRLAAGRPGLPIRGESWSKERIASAKLRAQEWLELRR